jgi:hypothetical protein
MAVELTDRPSGRPDGGRDRVLTMEVKAPRELGSTLEVCRCKAEVEWTGPVEIEAGFAPR